MYSVFIQWNENTSNYRRFDGGLQLLHTYTPIELLSAANATVRLYLASNFDKYAYKAGGLFDTNSREIVVFDNSTEPASVDFGDGTIYVAEVVE